MSESVKAKPMTSGVGQQMEGASCDIAYFQQFGDILFRMSGFREALDAGRETVRERLSDGKYYDPAGLGHNEARLRGMVKWRFILIRGIIGFAPPMFLFVVLTNLSTDIHTAHAFHQPTLRYLLGAWMVVFGLSVSLGFVIGLLAWRRLVSDVWPGAKPDQESCITTLGLIRRQ